MTATPATAHAPADCAVALHINRAHRAALGALLATEATARRDALRNIADAMHTPAAALLPRLLALASPSQRLDLERTF